MKDRSSNIVKSSEIIGVQVKNSSKENLGKIEEIVLNKESGEARYVVLSFGGILGLGDKLFALPWKAICYDTNEECFILNVDKDNLKDAPGFDKDNWPDMAQWSQTINEYYNSMF